MVNFDPLAAEIVSGVWGTPATFNGFRTVFSSGRQPTFAALNRGRHLCSTGRPSRWALAHISSWFCGCCRESKLTQLIKECLSSSTNRVCMIAHVSPATHAYNETLQVLQLASRLQRLRTRRKTSKVSYAFNDYRRSPQLLKICVNVATNKKTPLKSCSPARRTEACSCPPCKICV